MLLYLICQDEMVQLLRALGFYSDVSGTQLFFDISLADRLLSYRATTGMTKLSHSFVPPQKPPVLDLL